MASGMSKRAWVRSASWRRTSHDAVADDSQAQCLGDRRRTFVLEPEGRDLLQALAPHRFLKRNLLDSQQAIERLPLGPRGKSALRHHQLGFAMRWRIRSRWCGCRCRCRRCLQFWPALRGLCGLDRGWRKPGSALCRHLFACVIGVHQSGEAEYSEDSPAQEYRHRLASEAQGVEDGLM